VSNGVAPGLAHLSSRTDHHSAAAATVNQSSVTSLHLQSSAAAAVSADTVPSKLIEDHLSLQAITRAYQVSTRITSLHH